MKISIALTSGQLSGALDVAGRGEEKREPSEIPRPNEIAKRMGKERDGSRRRARRDSRLVLVVVVHTAYLRRLATSRPT